MLETKQATTGTITFTAIKNAAHKVFKLGEVGVYIPVALHDMHGTVINVEISTVTSATITEKKTILYCGPTELGSFTNRFYWKKVDEKIEVKIPAEIVTMKLEEITDDPDEGVVQRLIICADKERYVPYVKGNRVSLDAGDEVALFLRRFPTLEEVREVAARLLIAFEIPLPKSSKYDAWGDHILSWAELNNGQQRMLIGQALRKGAKRDEFKEALVTSDDSMEFAPRQLEIPKPSRSLPVKTKRGR